MRRLRAPLACALLAAALATACGEPPNKELQQAEGAISAARAAGAERYAHEEFQAAVDALERARASVTERDYRSALNNALGSRERAENAGKRGADAKAQAKAAAEQAVATLAAGVMTGDKHAQSLESARATRKAGSVLRRAVTDAQTSLQEARTAFDGGDFESAARSATTATEPLATAIRASAPQPPPATRRRR